MSETKKTATTALECLLVLQRSVKVAKANTNENNGDAFSYRTVSDILAALKTEMNDLSCGIVFSDEPVEVNGWHYIKVTATLIASDGSNMDASAHAREDLTEGAKCGAQLTGSAETYAKKRALENLLAIDDTIPEKPVKDPDSETHTPEQKTRTQPQQQQQQGQAEKPAFGRDVKGYKNIVMQAIKIAGDQPRIRKGLEKKFLVTDEAFKDFLEDLDTAMNAG